VTTDRIDFISEYCDRWCERCAFTSRCAAFATEIAYGMCGDLEDAIELAVGRPADEQPEPADVPDWVAELESVELEDEEEIAESSGRERARQRRVDSHPLMTLACAVSLVANRWLDARRDAVAAGADAVLNEALAIAAHDAMFMTPKLGRALSGRDRHAEAAGEAEDDPIQNDWNGSAKIALISIDRSEPAWRVIAQATGDEVPAAIADQLRDLRREVERAFPDAWSFVRPGFDEPGR
jgi:hypothetical protein